MNAQTSQEEDDMGLLSRDAVLAATSVPIETVKVPELGGEVRVRGMTGTERDAFEASCVQGRGRKRDFNMQNLRAKMVAYCCVDDDGRRLFTDQDLDRLGAIRADVLDRLFGVAQRLSGMRDEDVEELGQALESPIASATSSSVSPSNSDNPPE